MDRTILHCDCNGFFASVECILNPELKKIPMAVAGDPDSRHGIILAKNELAKAYDVKTAETIWQAKRKCPNLVLVPPHHSEYTKYSLLAREVYNRFTDLVEPFGIDEAWLDVTGVTHLFGNGEEIAKKIRTTMREELGLTVSIGISFNKIFAKLGSDYKKPDAQTLITRENYKQILHPLPAKSLLYVGKSTEEALEKMAIHSIGDIAKSDKNMLIRRLGKAGGQIHDYANGLDDSPVLPLFTETMSKSIGTGSTFSYNVHGEYEIRKKVHILTDEVTIRMRQQNVKCTTVAVTIKTPDFKQIVRQKTFNKPTYLTKEIVEIAMDIIKSAGFINTPIRMLTITANNLVKADEAAEQLNLFDIQDDIKTEKIENAIDSIRQKFGKDIISFGTVVETKKDDKEIK